MVNGAQNIKMDTKSVDDLLPNLMAVFSQKLKLPRSNLLINRQGGRTLPPPLFPKEEASHET